MKKYRAQFDQIEIVNVVRETPKYVVFKSHSGGEYKDSKFSDWRGYFDTWEDARQFLKTIAQQKFTKASDELLRAGRALKAIKEMQPQ